MNSSKRLILPALVALAIVLVVAGCGDGGSDGGGDSTSNGDTNSSGDSGSGDTNSGGDTAALTKAEFIKQADAACTKGSKEVEAEFTAYLKENKIKEIGEGNESKAEAEGRIEEVIEAAIPTLRQQLDAIRALGAPDGEEAQINAYLEAAEEGIKKGEEDPVELFIATEKVLAKSDKLAGEIGFKVCGQR